MLIKLIKHDLKASSRTLLPIYLLLIAVSFVYRIFLFINPLSENPIPYVSALATFIFVILIAIIVIQTFIHIVTRFHKSLFEDEGYLMHTLPVKPHQLVTSKLISSVVYAVASALVILSAYFILLFDTDVVKLIQQIYKFLDKMFFTYLDGYHVTILLEIALLIILFSFMKLLSIFLSIGIGHLFRKGHIAISIISFFVLDFLTQLVYSILSQFGIDSGDSLRIIARDTVMNLAITNIITLIMGAGFYFATIYIIKNKLNLE